MIMVPKLTLNDARLVLEGAEARAKAIGVDMDIAVVDDGGHLLAFIRMDNARVTSIDVAISKAFTAACARRATHEYAAVAGAGGPAFGIHVSNQGRFMIVVGNMAFRMPLHRRRGIFMGCPPRAGGGERLADRHVPMLVTLALSIRMNASRCPPSSTTAMSMSTPIAFALASAPSSTSLGVVQCQLRDHYVSRLLRLFMPWSTKTQTCESGE